MRASSSDSAREAYRRRLILEEFFLFQAALLLKGRELKQERGISFHAAGPLHKALRDSLPFELTPAQERVLQEIMRDMEKAEPMNRLLQGDVGCGKTICAVAAACIALDSGFQVAFLAPTEILAEQQYLTIHRTFEAMGIPPVLLRGNMGRRERDALLQGIKEGALRIVVGTHALLQEDVTFRELGLAIIDEQHRFGVLQRKALKEKGLSPDMLVMTATPIPRTLAMVVFGDLDVSIIDGMPPGRQKIVTKVFSEAGRERAYRLVEDELRAGRQAFFVYPLVDESDKIGAVGCDEDGFSSEEGRFPYVPDRSPARQDEGRRERGDHALVQARRDRSSRVHNRCRGRYRYPECKCDARGACRTVRALAAPSAPGPRWTEGHIHQSAFSSLPPSRRKPRRGGSGSWKRLRTASGLPKKTWTSGVREICWASGRLASRGSG